MWYFVTEEMRRQHEDIVRQEMDRLYQESKEKAERQRQWREAHPKCPHCGHEPQLPVWLQ